MTAKEKAEELVFSMDQSISIPSSNCSKSCALVAVEEILRLPEEIWGKQWISAYKYWTEVKQEINKL